MKQEAKRAQPESASNSEPQRTAGTKRKTTGDDVVVSQNETKKVRTATIKNIIAKVETGEKGSAENPVLIGENNVPITPKNQTSSRGIQEPTPSSTTVGSSRSSGSRITVGLLPNTPVNSRHRIPTPRTQRRYYQGDFNEPGMDNFDTEEELISCYAMAGRPPPSSGFSWRHPPARLGRLGLLNGRYSIDSVLAGMKWPELESSFSLVFTLSGSVLWGRFNLGGIRGVLRIAQRPQYASYQAIEFRWRGESDEHDEPDPFERIYGSDEDSPVMTGDGHKGHIKFLGNGRIEARLYFMKMTFSGKRLEGRGMRSEINASEMEAEWNKFAGNGEDDHEEEGWF